MRWRALRVVNAAALLGGLFVLLVLGVTSAAQHHALRALAVADPLPTLVPLSPSPSPSPSPSSPAPTGTLVCGDLPEFETTRWTASGSPYRICPSGVHVSHYAQLVLDGAQGEVDVVATGVGGISSADGWIWTENTTSQHRIVFDSVEATVGSWAGIDLGSHNRYEQPQLLEHVTVRHAVVGVSAADGDATLRDVVVSDTSSDGIRLGTLAMVVEDSRVTRAGRDGINTSNSRLQLRRTTVDQAARTGIRIEGDQPIVEDNVVTNSGVAAGEPAMRITGEFWLSGAFGVTGNAGSGNGLDAIALLGKLNGSATWISPTTTVAGSPSVALGYLNLGLRQGQSEPATMTIPDHAVVKTGRPLSTTVDLTQWGPAQGRLDVSDLTIGSDVTFTSLTDDSVGVSTCHSALADSCLPQVGDWSGVSGMRTTYLGGSIRYSITGLDAGGSVDAGDSRVEDVSVSSSGGGISLARGTLRRSSVTNITKVAGVARTGIALGPSAVTAEDLVVHDVAGEALRAAASIWDPSPELQLRRVEVARADGGGIWVHAYENPVVQDLVVTDAHGGWLGMRAAVRVDGEHLDVGSGRRIDRISGARNDLDALDLSGSVDGGLAWVTPAPDGLQSPAPLGYVGINGGLTVNGGQLSLPPATVAKTIGFTLRGAVLDTSAGRVVIAAPTNDTVAPKTCLDDECGRASWGYGPDPGGPDVFLTGEADSAGTPSRLTLDRIDLRDLRWLRLTDGSSLTAAAAVITGQSPAPHYPSNYPDGPPGLLLRDSSVSLRDTTTTGLGMYAASSDVALLRTSMADSPRPFMFVNSTVSAQQVALDRMGSVGEYAGVALYSSSTTFDRVRLTGARVSDAYASVQVADGSLDASCTAVRDGRVTLMTDASAHTTIADSDLYGGSEQPELMIETPTVTSRTWFGQAGGPRREQVDHPDQLTVQQPASSLAPTATIDVSGPTDASGRYEAGDLVVSVTFARTMDRSTEPDVRMTGPDRQPHPVLGGWTGPATWVGRYRITSSSASNGSNTIDVSAARSCVFDPATNQMTPARSTIEVSGGSNSDTPSSPGPSASSSASPAPRSPTPSSTPPGGVSAQASPTGPATCPDTGLGIRVNTPTINATGFASVTVLGSQPGRVVELQGYSQNHAGTASFDNDTTPVDRVGTADANGNLTFNDLRPASNTRLRARNRGCAYPAQQATGVIAVRTQLTLSAQRVEMRRYAFSGASIPARPGGLVVGLYRVADGREELIGQARADATSGKYRLAVSFPSDDVGRHVSLVVKTGRDAQNIAGRSNVRVLAVA